MGEVGLTSEQFWRLTPAQFYKLVDVSQEKIKREDRRTGILSALIRRVAGDKKADIWDLFPEHQPKKQKQTQGQTAAEIRANFKAILAAQKKRK